MSRCKSYSAKSTIKFLIRFSQFCEDFLVCLLFCLICVSLCKSSTGITLKLVKGPRPDDLTIGCTMRDTIHDHYFTRIFPLCSVPRIADHVWLTMALDPNEGNFFTSANAKFVVTGSLPFS